MNYAGLVTALSNLMVVPANNANFLQILPDIINDAEGRIYKDMDFLAVQEEDTSKAFSIGVRSLAAPDRMVQIEQVMFVLSGRRVPLRQTSDDYINNIWPDWAVTGVPVYWGLKDQGVILAAPTPGVAYPAVFVGKMRPLPISDTNTETYLSAEHPELLLAACMVFAAGYQRDFGAQASDPQSALSWEAVYQSRLASSRAQEARTEGEGRT